MARLKWSFLTILWVREPGFNLAEFGCLAIEIPQKIPSAAFQRHPKASASINSRMTLGVDQVATPAPPKSPSVVQMLP
jgi:hypothetical protein